MGSVVIDHVSIRVSDLDASRRLYEAALQPLGFALLAVESADGRGYGFGRDERDDFAIHEPIDDRGRDRVTTGAHVAFAARSRDEVDAFHAAALAHGAIDIGAPGTREQYADGYYGAYVLDLDGNNVEAVWHEPAT